MANINVKVNADTSTAKQALQDLQRQLDQLSNPTKLTSSNMSSELMKAAQAAEILKTQLEQATNVNTGRLDLTKFTQQLSQSGMSLEKYQQYFKQFGAQGQKAFATLASSIAQAEIPLKNMNSMTQKMWTSIKNTINWQISSSLIHGIVGQFSTMVNYAKDLDKSLNNIQIVTGASAQKMTQFAQQANQAAKQLNTTTTAYTNASLIYYQQGLSDKEVKARTDVTVKLANVTKESVTDVSNQLTAIWNNFAEGSGNLEHFADVITALGAATASSSKEIATGLEKFASIADTVGLSYEKATAALATVTAKTRQSADTVGTGFRTIFSRLQSLSLGETLDDGVNLTKYTKALKTVGVQALDTSGNLRSMDNIIMDVGEKWEKLTDSQKMAFANTVGGVRQYATLVALFDDFDQFKSNLSIAETSDGTLQNQADIYAESWEAAGKRVRATAEGIYGRLVNSDDIVSLMDTFSGFLEMIQGIIDGLGGLKGVLTTLGAIATTVFSKQISTGLENMGISLMTMTRAGRNYLTEFQKNAINTSISHFGQANNERDAALVRSYKNQQADNLAYLTYGSRLNESQQAQMRGLMDFNRGLYAKAEEAGTEAFTAKTDYQALRTHEEQERYNQAYNDQIQKANEKYLAAQAANKSFAPFNPTTGTYATGYENVKNNPAALEAWLRTNNYLTAPKPQAPLSNNQITEEYNNLIGYGRGSALLDIMTKSKTARTEALGDWETMRAGIKERVGTYKDENGVEQINYQEFFKGLGELSAAAVKAAQALDTLKERSDSGDIPPSDTEGTGTPAPVQNVDENAQKLEEGLDTSKVKSQASTEAGKKAINTDTGVTNTAGAAALGRDKLLELLQQPKDLTGGQAISKIAGAATAAASAVMMLSNAFKVLGDDSATGSQKLGAAMSMIMGIGTALPAISGIVEAFGTKVVLMGGLIKTTFAEIFAVVAAVAAVGALIGYVISKTDTDEKQLKRATESARELQDNYKAAADYSKSLKDAFSNYDNIADTLNNCIKYSDEWYAALENVRSAVLDILQEFPELAQFGDALEWDEDLGGYKLNEDVRKQATKVAEQNELVAKAAALEGQNNLNILKTQQQEKTALSTASKQAYKDILSSDKMSYTIGSGDDAKSNSFAIGTVLSNWLSALTVDQLQELKASGFKEELATQIGSSKEFASYVSEYNQDYGTNYTTDSLLKSIDTELIQFSNNYTKNGGIDELIEAQKQEDLQETAEFNRDRLIASNALKDQGYSALETDIAARAYRENVDKKEADILSILKVPGRAGAADNWGNLNSKFTKIIEDYIKSSNGKYTQAVLDDVISVSGTQRYINLQTASGVENVRIETIASTVAAQQALEEMGNSAAAAQTKLETFDTNFEKTFGSENKDGILNTSMKNFMATGGLGTGVTQNSLQLLKNTMGDIAPEEFLKNLFGVDDTTKDSYAKGLGYDNFSELTNAFTTAQQRAIKANQNVLTKINGYSYDKLNKDALADIDTENLTALSKVYENIYKYGNKDTFNQLTDLLSAQTNSTDLLNILSAFQDTDWSSQTSVTDFINTLNSLSLPSDFDISGFIDAMSTVEQAANGIDITGFKNTMDEVQKLLGTKPGYGSTIDKETVTKLTKEGYQLAGLGFSTSSGSLVLTSSVDEFVTSMINQTEGVIADKLSIAAAHKQGDQVSLLNPNDKTLTFQDVLNQANAIGLSDNEIKDLYTNYNMSMHYGATSEQALALILRLVNTKTETYNKNQVTTGEQNFKTSIIQAAESFLTLTQLGDFLSANMADGSNMTNEEFLISQGIDVDQLRSMVVQRHANYRGYDVPTILKAGEKLFTSGLMNDNEYDNGYLTVEDAQEAIITKLVSAERQGYDANSLMTYADALLTVGDGANKTYLELLDLAMATQDQANNFNSSTDAVIEYANKFSELPEFFDSTGAELTLLSAQMLGLANTLQINTDELFDYTIALMRTSEFAGQATEDVMDFAAAILQQKKGIESLTSNYATWNKYLSSTAAHTSDWSKAQKGAKQALADILKIPVDELSDGFADAANEAGILKDIIHGDETALIRLSKLASSGYLENIFLSDKVLSNTESNLLTQFDTLFDALQTKADGTEMTFGTSIDETGALDGLQQLIVQAGLTATQANALLSQIGYKPKVTMQTVTLDNYAVDEGGSTYHGTVSVNGVPVEVSGDISTVTDTGGAHTIQIPVIDGKGTQYTGGGDTGGGGGGGGGKKKPHKPKRYRVIENKIQDNNRNKERISRDKDRAFGTAKLDLLKQQRDLEKENLKLQQQYLSEIDEWLGKDKQDLIEKMAKINFTPEFDENGIMTNMDEFEAAWAKLADGSDEAWTEAGEALDQYQETLAKYKDKLKELEEIQQAIFDSFLEETQLEVEMKINVNTANIEYIDYLLGKIEDDAYQAAEAIALLGHKTGEIEIQASVYRKGINDILSHHTLADGTQLSLENIGSMTTDQLLAAGFTDAEIQELQKYRSELLQLNQQLLEMRDTVADKVVDALEKMNEEIQKSYENFDHYNSVLEHYKNINDLINIGNTKMSKEIAGKLNRAMLSNAQNQVKSAREIYDAAKLNMQNAQAEYENALAVGDEQTAKYWKKIMDAASDQLKESKNQWLEAWESALEQAKAFFETTIQDIVDTYNEQMGSTFGSLDYLQAAYDRQKETNEQYLQDYDRLYELSKLSRDISKSIDDTDSIKGKQKLRDIQAEINKLQADGTKLSQYDIEALQKKYELEKARLALEDAQNAKQTVRLQRDSEGNWGYVYTADEDKVAEAEQEYEDKLHEYQKLNDEYIQELQDKALSAQATYRDLIQEIMSDTTLTDEQRQARLEEVQNWYNEQINFFGQQLTNALNNQEGTLDRYYQRYNDERAKLVDSWKETTLSLLTGTGSMDDYMAHMRESASQMVETAYQALLQYKQDIDQTDAMAGQDSSFSEMVSGVVSGIGELSTATEASISTLADTMTDEFATALQAAVSWESQYVSEMMQMIAQTEAEVTAVNNLIAALSGLDTTALYAAANATVGAAGAGQASTSAANAAEQAAKATAAYSTNPYYASGEKKMTEDFLHIVNDNMVDCNVQLDDIIHMLELQVNAFSEGLGALISAPGIANEPQDILEQNIHIDVSFPNVTQHSEIEKAFENLVNKAAQYANRKN